ncbi:hypothetical protein OAI64_05990, partial [Schleiferiaceae bacterium]|nr:hypothetical protein [Schleiferiaceae bacterium]
SVFSQDLIVYDNGTFTKNGEELSMEQVKDLVNHFNVGEPKFRRAKKCLRLAQKRNPGVRNTLNGIGGVAAGLVSPIFVAVGVDFLIDRRGEFPYFYHPPTGCAFIALGTVSTLTAEYLFSNIGNKQTFELRANKKFNKVAGKLNEAIKASNQ